MIEKLTPEQEAQLTVYRDKWIKIGLATGPANRAKAENALKQAYDAGGLDAPKTILWADSPLAGAKLAAAAVKLNKVPTESDTTKVTRSEVLSQFDTAIFGQHDANWLSFYEYFLEVVGIKEAEKLRGLMELAKEAGWCWVFDELAIITERPTELHLDTEGRLHNITAPAVLYKDGFNVCAVHGVRIPEDIILKPETLTAKRIDAENNVEVRRVMLDLFGIEKYLTETNTQCVHQDKFGKLYRRPMQGDEDLVVVRVTNSTPEPDGSFKDYFLRVRPTVKTAHEAVASTFNISAEEYRLDFES